MQLGSGERNTEQRSFQNYQQEGGEKVNAFQVRKTKKILMDESPRHSAAVGQRVREQDSKEEEKEEVLKLGPNKIGDKHYFEVIRDGGGYLVAQCTKCPHGYHLGPRETVKDGHIYIEGDLVV